MTSIRELHIDEIIQGHREALAALRQLLATEEDRLERRKLANAILRTRPVKQDAEPPAPAQRKQKSEPAAASAAEEALSSSAPTPDDAPIRYSGQRARPDAGFSRPTYPPRPTTERPAPHSGQLELEPTPARS